MLTGWGGSESHVAMTLYTDAYLIRGVLATRQRRLSDVLNRAEDEFLVLTDATLEPLVPAGRAHAASYAQVNLAAILFAVSGDPVEPVPELRTPKVAASTLISIPPFSITGRIHLLPDPDVRTALLDLQGRFLPVTEARFWSDSLGGVAGAAEMLAVNHARAQILSPYDEPASAPDAEPSALIG